MPGIRVDRFLASTAVLLVLTAAAGGALADPKSADKTASAVDTAMPMPEPAKVAAPAPTDSDKTANPAQTTDQPGTPAPTPAAATPVATPQPAGTADAPAATPTPAATPAEAAAPASTTPAATTLSAADAPIADQLHNLANGQFDHTIGNKKDRTQIAAFYSGRNYPPGGITERKLN